MTQTVAAKTDSIWNEVTFTGNLGRDPEMSFTTNGNAVTKFSIAVGQGKDKPSMWLDVEVWKQLAEQCNAKLSKGARVEVGGRLAQESWDDKESGKKRYRFKVVAQGVRLLKRSEGKAASGFTDESEQGGSNTGLDALGDLDDHPF